MPTGHFFNGLCEEVISLQLAKPQMHSDSQHKLVYKPTLKGNKRDDNLTAYALLAGLQETMQQGTCKDRLNWAPKQKKGKTPTNPLNNIFMALPAICSSVS